MFGLKTLDVGIGMALMFLFVSLICSAIREFGEALLKTRASSLEKGIMELLGEGNAPMTWKKRWDWIASRSRPAPEAAPVEGERAQTLTERFYNQPMINALYSGNYNEVRPGSIGQYIPWIGRNGLPSYIPAESFARALMQIARVAPSSGTASAVASTSVEVVSELRIWATQLPDTHLRRAMRTALDGAENDVRKVQAALEQWFNSAMDRVSGWYTRRTQVWLFCLGLICATLMNIDAITVMKSLSTDDKLREAVVAAAGDEIARCEKKPVAPDCRRVLGQGAPDVGANALDDRIEGMKLATAQMNEVNWPIGWDKNLLPAPQNRVFRSSNPNAPSDYIAWFGRNPLVLLGWLITAFGVTFGASFWFDVLNKFMIVRSTVKPDEKSPKEGSKS